MEIEVRLVIAAEEGGLAGGRRGVLTWMGSRDCAVGKLPLTCALEMCAFSPDHV